MTTQVTVKMEFDEVPDLSWLEQTDDESDETIGRQIVVQQVIDPGHDRTELGALCHGCTRVRTTDSRHQGRANPMTGHVRH